MDLAASLAWLDSHINLEKMAATAGRAHGLSLDKMRRLVDVLGDPHRAYPVVHITGTNGKGSTARMITGLLAESGLTVGTYTSPHLQRINERISRNGEPIADEELATVLSDIASIEPLAGVEPSYFEIMTAAAYRWFADVAVDVAVVEVGLLGRYDATNVADGTVAVITNVGHDHTDFEGDWRAAIAGEKAGIIKPGSWVVLGETDPDLIPIFEREPSAGVWRRGEDFGLEANDLAVGGRSLDIRTPGGVLEQVFLAAHGAHQGDNAAVAVAATEAFLARPLDAVVVGDALREISLQGRFEIVGRNPLVVLDGAHNPDGGAAVAQTLEDDFTHDGERVLVVGMLAGRDPLALLEALDAASARLVVGCTPDSPRACDADTVAAVARDLGVDAVAEPDVARAVDLALDEAAADDAVLVTGSLYVAGAARTHLLD
ncbi:MAG: bifunctional folylpolyglutamate synthase/dihydrofolate synthase [Acidimicrobiales bacterium]